MSIRAFAFDLYGTLIEDLGRDSYDALLRHMAAVLLQPADGFSSAWRQVGNRRTTGGFATLEECLTHICNVLGTQVAALSDVMDLVDYNFSGTSAKKKRL